MVPWTTPGMARDSTEGGLEEVSVDISPAVAAPGAWVMYSSTKYRSSAFR